MGFALAVSAFVFGFGLLAVVVLSSLPKAFLRVARLVEAWAAPVVLVLFAMSFVFLVQTWVVLFGLSQ